MSTSYADESSSCHLENKGSDSQSIEVDESIVSSKEEGNAEDKSEHQLTIKNLKQYEKETSPFPVEELIMKKQTELSSTPDQFSSETNKNPMLLQIPEIRNLPNHLVDPAHVEIARGLKLSGEEYEAVSIDVQTDESWLFGQIEFKQDYQKRETAGSQPMSPSSQILEDADQLPAPESLKNLVSNVSVSDLIESGEEEVSGQSRSSSEFGDNFPVLEINIDDSSSESHEGENIVENILPPSILQYRRESEETDVDYVNLKPPAIEEVDEEQQEYYNEVISLAKIKREHKAKNKPGLININPHDAFSSKQEKREEKERALAKNKAKEAEKKKLVDTQAANQANFYAFARQLKTINYSLSSEKCMDDGWTVRPESPEPPAEPAKQLFVQEPSGADIGLLSGRKYQRNFLQKFYDNGSPFLNIFPDGTGTVWYISGNVAISIISTEKKGKLIYLVQEDKCLDERPQLQAVFEPDGKCTCYHPNGVIRTNLNPFGGECYSVRGERLKRWQWRDKETHVHAPPFQPITFGLSRQIGVRIMAQESIYLTFSEARRSVRFNVGTKLRIKSGLPTSDQFIDMNSILLQERIVYVQSLLQRFYYTFEFPHSPRTKHMKLPLFLNNKMKKIAKLRASVERLPPLTPAHLTPPAPSPSLLLPQIPPIRRKKRPVRRSVKNPPESENQFAVTVN